MLGTPFPSRDRAQGGPPWGASLSPAPGPLYGPPGGPREIKSSACRDSGLRVISVGSVRGRCGPT